VTYHFLSVNRGRYLCKEHGAFCDSSDGYLDACPLCPSGKENEWAVNNVDRALQILANLQSRSQRSLTVVSGLFGAFGLASLLSKASGGDISALQMPVIFPALSAALFLISIWFFLTSMAHMDLIDESGFMTLGIEEWENKVADCIRDNERLHFWAGVSFGAAITVLSGGLLFIIVVA